MGNIENRSVSQHPVDVARHRQESGCYEDELVPQALYMIRVAAHQDEQIDATLNQLDLDKLGALKDAKTVQEFEDALLCAFGDQSVQVITASLQRLGAAISLYCGGRKGNSLSEMFGDNPEVILNIHDISTKAKSILRDLGSDIMAKYREPLLVAGSVD